MDLQGEGRHAYRPRERALSPLPPFGKALGDFVENLADRKRRITTEQVDSVTPDGKVLIRGNILPVTGRVPIVAGETVAVAWRDGKMDVVLLNQGRRSGGAGPTPLVANPVVEELFVANRTTDGVRDVFFRNADQCRALRVDRFAEITPALINQVKWGPGNDRFYIQQGSTIFHVMKFSRKKFTAFEPGTNASTKVTRERTENVAANTTLLATLTRNVGGSPTIVTVTPQSGNANLVSVSLDLDGALIGAFRVSAFYAIGSDNLPVGFRSTASPFVGQPGVAVSTAYPVVADLTNGIVLLSAVETPDMFEPFWPMVDVNNGPLTIVTYYDGTPTGVVIRPTTFVQANTFTATISPGPPPSTDVAWWVGYSQTPSEANVFLEPTLVLGKSVAPSLRVRGYVAWALLGYTVAVGQTNSEDFNQFFFPSAPNEQLVFPTAPFPVTNQSAAIAQPTLIAGAPAQSLFAQTRPSLAFSYAPTYNRILWKQPTGSTFARADQGLNQGADTPGFVRLFKTGVTTQITAQLRTTFGRHAVNVVPADYVYQLDNPSTALAANARTNYFIDAWAFAGNVKPPGFDDGKYPEDAALRPVKALKDIPAGVIHPTGLGEYALQIVNDQGSLAGLGRFERVPTGA